MEKEMDLGTGGVDYQVFLSFRGPDTRQGFTDCLFEYLRDAGVRVFRDDDELSVGHQIGHDLMRAIDSSKIYIPVFSKTYASSKWCLRELARMVDATRKSKVKEIIPIFYDVTTDDVKLKTELYDKAIKTHEDEKIGTVEEWKEALKAVCKIKGWEVKNEGLQKHNFPLSLEIIGSLLNGKPERVWRNTIEELEVIPSEEVQGKMMISYNLLDERAKEIFLDITCLFVGEEKTNPMYMWEASKFFPANRVDMLIAMSLVKIVDYDEFWVHDQVKDLGREIVRRENLEAPIKRSRIWEAEEAISILKCRNQGKGNIKALRLGSGDDSSSSSYTFTHENFERLHNLRFLELPGAQLAGNFRDLLSKLKWLSWHGCPLNMEATNLSLNLVILDLSKSEISECWDGWNQLKVMKNLKVLNLTGCKNLRKTPNFLGYKALERLILDECEQLLEIDCSIGKLKGMKHLSLWSCSALKGLPEEICSLEDLQEIFMVGNGQSFQLPEAIGCLKCLTILEIEAVQISSLPNSVGGLKSLVRLSLKGAGVLELPDTIHGLVNLEYLNLSDCPLKILPDSIGEVTKLESLFLSDCDMLTNLPASMRNLRSLVELNLSNSGVTNGSHCIEGLVKLERLSFAGSTIPDSIGDMASLVELNLYDTEVSELPDSIGNLNLLKVLNFENCPIRELPGSIGKLKKLEAIYARDSSLCEVPTEIGMLPRLIELSLSNTRIGGLPSSISELSCLQELWLEHCDELQQLPPLPTSLIHLQISSKSLKQLPDLSNCINLQTISLSLQEPTYQLECSNVDWIGRCSKLISLVLFISGLTSMPSELSTLSRLQFLNLHCLDLKQLPKLLSGLSLFSLTNFRGKTLPDMSHLKKLEYLYISLCEELVEIPGLGKLESLVRLHLTSCNSLEKLDDFASLEKLSDLKVWRCPKLTNILGMEELESLTAVDIKDCPFVESHSLRKKQRTI